jgi:hypothetical protein
MFKMIICFLPLFFLSTASFAKKAEQKKIELNWEDLLDYDLKTKKAGPKVAAILSKEIELKGFMIPLDFNAKELKEFILLPYIPSCSHVPPPPNNQIILVKMTGNKAILPTYYPVAVSGKLSIMKVDPKKKKSEELMGLDEAGFEMQGIDVKEIKE